MVLSIYSVTYASYGEVDGELFTDTKVFVDEDKARAYQQSNIQGICGELKLGDDYYEERKNDTSFEYASDGRSYKTTLRVQDYEFYLQERK